MIATWYQRCPECGSLFGRGKGAGGLARHLCDEPLVIKLRARLARVEKIARRLLAESEAREKCPYKPFCPADKK